MTSQKKDLWHIYLSFFFLKKSLLNVDQTKVNIYMDTNNYLSFHYNDWR